MECSRSYGDLTPNTSLEVGITIVVQLVGAVLFGWIIGNIANLLADFDQVTPRWDPTLTPRLGPR